ncbi:MAG: enoyl-CoA hydratase/isomerase family protein [Deltaproteobacteria bacterium]|nr:enoyl-CoA hydratase/isomerase family protein [Deltaproteobacteria bacterium]
MQFTRVTVQEQVGTVSFERGKVNAINEALVMELTERLQQLAADPQVKAVILTAAGKFFSFGFDIPEFLSFSREDFTRFLTNFTSLYRKLFLFPKPVVAALNGHTVAGGLMLATACDRRLMVPGKSKISLNEITFGSTLTAGFLEMLVFLVGTRDAQRMVYSGAMYTAEEALTIRLVDQVCSPETLMDEAQRIACAMAQLDSRAFASIKLLLRQPIGDRMREREPDSIKEFVDVWYSGETRKQLAEIKIRS